MCLSGCMSDPLWGFLIQYPHIFLYTNIQSPSPYAMLSYTQMSHVTPCFIILRSTARHPDKIWCIYLKIIKFLFNFYFWINIHDEFDETLKLCPADTHSTKLNFTFQFSLGTFILASRDVNMNLHSKKLIIFQI